MSRPPRCVVAPVLSSSVARAGKASLENGEYFVTGRCPIPLGLPHPIEAAQSFAEHRVADVASGVDGNGASPLVRVRGPQRQFKNKAQSVLAGPGRAESSVRVYLKPPSSGACLPPPEEGGRRGRVFGQHWIRAAAGLWRMTALSHPPQVAFSYFLCGKYFCRYFGSGAACPFWTGIR
jgi:hypothetical protein